MREYIQSPLTSMGTQTGKIIIFSGILLVLLGVVVYFFHNKLHWIGRLPGDVRIERENFRFYFPITTMLLFSLLLSILVRFIGKFLQ